MLFGGGGVVGVRRMRKRKERNIRERGKKLWHVANDERRERGTYG